MTRIVWLHAALDDLSGIHAYIARDNPLAARRVIRTIHDAANMLRDRPPL